MTKSACLRSASSNSYLHARHREPDLPHHRHSPTQKQLLSRLFWSCVSLLTLAFYQCPLNLREPNLFISTSEFYYLYLPYSKFCAVFHHLRHRQSRTAPYVTLTPAVTPPSPQCITSHCAAAAALPPENRSDRTILPPVRGRTRRCLLQTTPGPYAETRAPTRRPPCLSRPTAS